MLWLTVCVYQTCSSHRGKQYLTLSVVPNMYRSTCICTTYGIHKADASAELRNSLIANSPPVTMHRLLSTSAWQQLQQQQLWMTVCIHQTCNPYRGKQYLMLYTVAWQKCTSRNHTGQIRTSTSNTLNSRTDETLHTVTDVTAELMNSPCSKHPICHHTQTCTCCCWLK